MGLAGHVNEVVVAEELFSERVADDGEGVGSYIGEDLVGESGVADEEDEVSDDVVGGEAGRRGEGGLDVPEAGRVAD